MKKTYIAALAGAGLATLALSGSAMAFHDGGVARCEGCHSMHNSYGNAVHDTNLATQGTSGAYLLKGSDQSSACLNCHGSGTSTSSYHVATEGSVAGSVPQQFTPGGDFSWTKVDCSGDATRNSFRGHNIISADSGFVADSRAGMVTSPGGTYPNANFHCSSCHDPHGRYRVLADGTVATTGASVIASGSYTSSPAPTATDAVGAYRILAGVGYSPKSLANAGVSHAFVNDVPTAIAPSTYNTTAALGGVRVAYGSGMSEWCANCHGGFHDGSQATSGTINRHPSGNSDKLGATIAGNYNSYVKSGDMTGTQATSFLALVPFEAGLGQNDRAALAALVATTAGPDATANVMCLSCHRAHASGHDSMVRWNHKGTFLAQAGAYSSESGLEPLQRVASYQNKPASDFAQNQRSLCNKCHAKD